MGHSESTPEAPPSATPIVAQMIAEGGSLASVAVSIATGAGAGKLPTWDEAHPDRAEMIKSPMFDAVWNSVYPERDIPEPSMIKPAMYSSASVNEAEDIFSAAKEAGASREQAVLILETIKDVARIDGFHDPEDSGNLLMTPVDPYEKLVAVYGPETGKGEVLVPTLPVAVLPGEVEVSPPAETGEPDGGFTAF